MGLVGAGFVGPHHIDAVRRLGFVDIVAVAGSNDESGREKAEALGARKGYGSYQALIDDPDVQVVHNATPNHLHYEVTSAALAKGKHVVSDKPLAMTAAQANDWSSEAHRAGVVARGDVQLPRQSARAARATRDRPRRHRHAALSARPLPAGLAAQRHRLLVAPRPGKRRRVLRARRHRIALVRPRAARDAACGSRTCSATSPPSLPKRKKPRGSREAFQAADGDDETRRHQGRGPCVGARPVRQRRARAASQSGRSARGHKNDLVLEVCGTKASLRWRQEHQNELWIGHRDRANEILQKDPSLLDERVRRIRASARRPSGGVGRRVLQRDARDLHVMAAGRPIAALSPMVATFEDGFRANRIVDAILESAADGGAWTRDMTRFTPPLHEGGDPHGGAAGADATRAARRRSGSRD